MLGRSSQWIRIFTFGAASLIVAACSSSSGKSDGSGNTDGNGGGGAPGNGGNGSNTNNGGGDQGDNGGNGNSGGGGGDVDAGGGGGSDSGGGGGGGSASCGDTTTVNACVSCCDQQAPGGLDVFNQALQQCGCASRSACESACSSNFCNGSDLSDACNTCLQNDCINDAATACAADANCLQAVQCVNDSGCSNKQ